MAIVPRIPHDIIEEILNHLATDAGVGSLRPCALVSKSWTPSCRRHLFHTVDFTSKRVDRWLKTFPIPEQSPAHHARILRIWVGGPGWVPDEFFEHTPWFTNVHSIYLLGWEKFLEFRIPSVWRLPESITSLTIGTCGVTVAEIRDIMALLPNLDNLSIRGPRLPVDRRELAGAGTDLRGRFGGKLELRNVRYDNKDVMSILLEIPTGLRFTEVEIEWTRNCLPSVVRLVQVCHKTIVKLSHTVTYYDRGSEAFELSFDFSKFPNLQEVNLSLITGRMGTDLSWISMALLTLRPTTSPRLSSLRLNFGGSCTNQSIESSIKDMGNDLRRIADEVARIEREFEGAVDFTVVRDPKFEAAFDTLNILQYKGR